MEKIFKLARPISINNEEVPELKYDFDALTAADLRAAGTAYKKEGGIIQVAELDPDYHLFIFARAVEKASSEQNIDMTDITMRLSARDTTRAEALVRDFFFINSEV